MTTLSPDVRAVVRAAEALTAQVRRIADAIAPAADGPAAKPADAPCAQHPHAPVIGDHCGGCTQYPADMRPAPADDEEQRTTRRASTRNLLARAAAGLTPDEDALLRQHVETEIREADTARAVARSNMRHVQTIVPEIDRLAAELEKAQAALERVRALHVPITYPDPDMSGTKAVCLGCEDATSLHPCNTLAALDGTEKESATP